MINYFQAHACTAFQDLIREFPELRFFQPSPEHAPWHIQCVLDAGHGEEPIILNFWPHKNKGQRQPMPAVIGIPAIRALIEEAVADANDEPFDVIEG